MIIGDDYAALLITGVGVLIFVTFLEIILFFCLFLCYVLHLRDGLRKTATASSVLEFRDSG